MFAAYPWIVLCAAGCNSLFGLDDDARFVNPDAPPPPPDAGLKVCFTETFDSRVPGVWEDLAAPEAVQYGFIAGAFEVGAAGPVTGDRVGIRTTQMFDLVGGAVEITITDPSAAQAEAGVQLILDDNTFVAFGSRMDRPQAEFEAGFQSGSQLIDVPFTQLRLRHDASAAAFIWEVAARPGEGYASAFMPVLVPTPSAVRIAMYGRQRVAGEAETIRLDNLVVTATCL